MKHRTQDGRLRKERESSGPGAGKTEITAWPPKHWSLWQHMAVRMSKTQTLPSWEKTEQGLPDPSATYRIQLQEIL